MKRTFRCAALAAAFSLGLAGTASAVPIHFDFTGTITGVEGVEGVAVGAAISGGFTFETDRLVGTHRAGDPQYSWLDLEPVGLTEPYAFLNFGGRELAYPSAASGNYAVINFFDACRPDCGPLGPENFGMYASTGHSAAPDFTGIIQHSAFYFASAALTRLPDPPFIETFDYFDGAQVDPTSIVTLPLYDMVGFYSGGTMGRARHRRTSGARAGHAGSAGRGVGGLAALQAARAGVVGIIGVLILEAVLY